MTRQAWSLPSTFHISFVLWDHSKMNQYGHPSSILPSAEEWVCLQLPFYLFLSSTNWRVTLVVEKVISDKCSKIFHETRLNATCNLSLVTPVASWIRTQVKHKMCHTGRCVFQCFQCILLKMRMGRYSNSSINKKCCLSKFSKYCMWCLNHELFVMSWQWNKGGFKIPWMRVLRSIQTFLLDLFSA